MIISLGIQANNLSIIPYPNSVVAHPGTYQFDVCHLSFDKALKNEAMYLESMLKEDFGLSSITVKKGANIRLLLSPQFKNAEAYQLQIAKKESRLLLLLPEEYSMAYKPYVKYCRCEIKNFAPIISPLRTNLLSSGVPLCWTMPGPLKEWRL